MQTPRTKPLTDVSAIQNSYNRVNIVRMRKRSWLFCLGLAVAALSAYKLAIGKPILASTLGEWDCACGDWSIKTTRLAIWNPVRDRTPERVAESFLAGLRENNCTASTALCESALPGRRVSNWQLAYRKDDDDHVTLYFRLTKYGGRPESELSGIGVATVERRSTGWGVSGYDSYF